MNDRMVSTARAIDDESEFRTKAEAILRRHGNVATPAFALDRVHAKLAALVTFLEAYDQYDHSLPDWVHNWLVACSELVALVRDELYQADPPRSRGVATTRKEVA